MILGTCSECGGPVTMPSHMVNPAPRCEKCGATADAPYGPVIPMRKPRRVDTPSPYDPVASKRLREGQR